MYKNMKLFAVSFFVYLFVNMVENLFHYNIGKHSNERLKLEIPTRDDWIKIIVVMLVFAGLQGGLTCYVDGQC
jgi:hypothetical protein